MSQENQQVGNLVGQDVAPRPVKTRELHSHHFDSTIWNQFQFRDGDIVIATYAKSGTTRVQQIVAQLLLGPAPELAVAEMSPWLDLRVPPKEIKLASFAGGAGTRGGVRPLACARHRIRGGAVRLNQLMI